jgi:O-methyltransferase
LLNHPLGLVDNLTMPDLALALRATAEQLRRGEVVKRATAKGRRSLRAGVFGLRRPDVRRSIEGVRAKRLSFLSPEKLMDLADAVIDAERQGLAGAVVEAGTALGGSAIVLASAKSTDRPMWIFDAFGMIPPPSEQDGPDVHARYEEIASGKSAGLSEDLYYGYRTDLLGEVRRSFVEFGLTPESHNVTFVKGCYEETMHIDFPVAVAHIDCDWYESVSTCLEAIEPWLVPGGRFVIDDYFSWSGCAKAVDEFFAGRAGYTFVQKGRLHIVKVSG